VRTRHLEEICSRSASECQANRSREGSLPKGHKRVDLDQAGSEESQEVPWVSQVLPGTRCGLLGSHTWPLPASLGRSVRAPPLHHGWTLGGPGPSDCKVLPPPMKSRSSRPKLGKRHIWERARQRSDHPHRIHSVCPRWNKAPLARSGAIGQNGWSPAGSVGPPCEMALPGSLALRVLLHCHERLTPVPRPPPRPNHAPPGC
jgi:hypothetical protein